jgi:hypothetical protein
MLKCYNEKRNTRKTNAEREREREKERDVL